MDKLRISKSGETVPTNVTPAFIGQIYVNEVNGSMFRAYGTNVGEWSKMIDDNNTNITIDASNNVSFGDDTNYTNFESDGTMRFYGTATVFKDELQSLIKEAKNNASANIVDNLTEGTIDFKTTSTLDDYAIVNIQINHDWKIGSNIYPHIHWFQNQNETPNWLIQYRWQVNGGLKTSTWNNLTLNTNTFTDTYTNERTQISYGLPITPPVGAGLSDILQIKIIRDNNNTSTEFTGTDTYVGDVSALNFDVHYEINSIGSDEEYVK